MKETPKMPYVHGEPEGLGRKENLETEEEKKRLAGEAGFEGSVDEIDSFFNDLGQDREDDDLSDVSEEMRGLVEAFRDVPVNIQRELLEDMQRKMKRNFFRTKTEMIGHLKHLVDMNLKKVESEEAATVTDDPHITVKKRRVKK